jgi:hypothetical protein
MMSQPQWAAQCMTVYRPGRAQRMSSGSIGHVYRRLDARNGADALQR